MKSIPKKALVTAGVFVAGLGVASNAWADGTADNLSQISGSLNSPLQKEGSAGKVNLFTQVTTIDQDNAPAITAFPPEVVRVTFPNDMIYTTNSKLAQCDESLPAVSGDTTSAVGACTNALVGGGNARARIPGFPTPNNETALTVTAFNGLTSVAGDQNSTDVPTGGFLGGNPTILLHADNASLPTTLVQGEIIPVPGATPNVANFGKQLFVPDSPDVAGDAGALTQFNSQVAKTWDNGKSGNKKKTYNLTTSTCDDPDADPLTDDPGNWDFRGEWTYDDASVDADKIEQDCVIK